MPAPLHNSRLDHAFAKLANTIASRLKDRKLSRNPESVPDKVPEWIEKLAENISEQFSKKLGEELREVLKPALTPSWHHWVANFFIMAAVGLFLLHVDKLDHGGTDADQSLETATPLPLSPLPRGKGR